MHKESTMRTLKERSACKGCVKDYLVRENKHYGSECSGRPTQEFAGYGYVWRIETDGCRWTGSMQKLS